ncbi:RNase adaptor protein RapZ [Sphingorhabdus lutea]|uniref:RNase adaptor protein RapZ n=1 Tax=Sphingorhabdus lutea TaxID=1913578 RepID=A0A1L3JCG8_9SPHN|nr:RNase adapter RapZ [Sphingorhabdus lutea]APG62826.1 RNase adaptor protein RapZ [Sphingorhabdus lutea]
MSQENNKKHPKKARKILLVTGLSGAGKSTTVKTLEDLGWEIVDNFPITLIHALLETPLPHDQVDLQKPLAIGFDSRTRGYNPSLLIEQVKALQENGAYDIMTLFLDCSGNEIERRYTETRRPHPLAKDRPTIDGIAQDRQLMEPLRRWAETLIDTSRLSTNDLQIEIRERFSLNQQMGLSLTITSFGFARGVPHNADLIFDMRFLQNPHWVDELRPLTGLDNKIAEYVSSDKNFDKIYNQMSQMLSDLLPLYAAQGKAHVNIAFGCTGGRHRSVFVAEKFAKLFEEKGYSPTIIHRNLASRSIDALEGNPGQVQY